MRAEQALDPGKPAEASKRALTSADAMECINEIRRQRPTTTAQEDLLERCANSLDALTRKIEAGEIDKKASTLTGEAAGPSHVERRRGRGRGRQGRYM